MTMHLYFCGIKHSGKSTLGKLAAGNLGYSWIDLDDLVLNRIAPCPSIREFYRQAGKQAFMEAEVQALKEFMHAVKKPYIISLGGGTSDNKDLIREIKQSGKLIYLVVEEKVLLERILRGGVPPFLDAEDPEGSFATLYGRRHVCYSNICDSMIRLPNYPDVRDTARFLVETLKHEV
ncbi:MAG: shikimate kinase [Sphaerochaetaceae bacterium]